MIELFAMITALGFTTFCACLESYTAGVKADNASREVARAHLRLDRMQKSLKTELKETQRVSYTEGFSSRDDWSDDFRRTQVIFPLVKRPWYHRLIRKLFY